MKRVLIVDDDPGVRTMLRVVLEKAGYETVEASNGKEAVRLYHSEDIDLMIVDIIMPEKDGIETISELNAEFDDLKVIAISGGARISADTCLMMAKKLGAKQVFSKPFDHKELIDAVHELTKD